ncbi:cytochrome P450 [Glonium stellatum]|uniref:Cytochrome P450 n=1 Tax=Glonium stellatum TaxID=574774 RepID=A0A8E2EXM7_9PEZI|nr:cytochrome P450 [Glonium stellatum]
MDTQLLAALPDYFPILSTVALLVLVCIIFPQLFSRNHLSDIPIIGLDLGNIEKRRNAYLTSASKLYRDGYKMFRDGVYRITTADKYETVVISPKYLDELKRLPDEVLSFEKAIEEAQEAKYTNITGKFNLVVSPHIVKADLTPSLVRLNPRISLEVDRSLKEYMPPCNDWTNLNAHQTLLRIVAVVSGRVFIGPELCRSDEYLDSAIKYTLEVINASGAIKRIRPWLRPFLAPRLREVLQLQQREKNVGKFMSPVIESRIAAKGGETKPDDILQVLIDKSDDFGMKSSSDMAKVQLGLSFAAIHTTALTATNALYSLAASPEYIEPLRTEIRAVLAENGGIFTTKALQDMKKLDSFMKECLRVYPPSYASFQRKTLKGITLSSGHYIPPNTRIEVPAHAVSHECFSDGDNFDGFRYYKLRREGGAETVSKNQFVSVSQQSLTFGYGRHACPGRFFAGNEIKMILSRILLNYDMRTTDGKNVRYPNIEFSNMSIPDPSKELLFKRVKG